MISKELISLMKCFPDSFVNSNGEFIAEKKTNQYFNVSNVSSNLELKCNVLEWLSRPSSQGMPYQSEQKNRRYRAILLSGINRFLETSFTQQEMSKIYSAVGNGINRKLTMRFVESGYDLNLLEED